MIFLKYLPNSQESNICFMLEITRSLPESVSILLTGKGSTNKSRYSLKCNNFALPFQ